MKILLVVVGVIIGLIVLAYLGLQIPPKSFPAFPQRTPELKTVPLPADLPAPVQRFYRHIYGEDVPLIESAVITGRAQMRLKGISFAGRFRFTHDAGQSYRHYIEGTCFGLPLLKVNEQYVEGKSLFELPVGVIENDANTNQGANLALWAESIWLPSIWLTDSRVRWQPVDEVTAVLVVPFGEEDEHFIVRFDPETGLLRMMESMRYKAPEDTAKVLWITKTREWSTLNGSMLPVVNDVTWLDEGRPWAVFTVEDIVYNVDVQDYVRAKGL